MSDSSQPTFLVSISSESVTVRINGKANYLNCNTFREFLETMIKRGTSEFVLDFANCKGMDSTFLGIMAGTALELRKKSPPGALILAELSEKNFALIKNLGLHHLLTFKDGAAGQSNEKDDFAGLEDSHVSNPNEVLKAHENLTHANEENIPKFQDVISFLRDQVENKENS